MTALRLRDCESQSINALPDIFRGIRALKIFTLEIQAPCYGRLGAIAVLTVYNLARSLADHSNTLVELIIAASNGAEFPSLPIGSLAHFTALKRLGIPETFLVNSRQDSMSQLLPSSLAVLQLQYPISVELGPGPSGFNNEPFPILHLRILAAEKSEYLPRLARLIWWEQHSERFDPWTCWTRFDFEILEAELGEQNVEFTFVSSPFYAGTPLAADEADGTEVEGLTRWNMPSEKRLSFTEVCDLKTATTPDVSEDTPALFDFDDGWRNDFLDE